MKLIDTHAHLDMVEESISLEDVFANCRDNAVERIVTIGASSGPESNRRAAQIAEAHDHIKCTAGIHPHEASDFSESFFEQVQQLATRQQVVAVGETGLDYHYDNSPREVQRSVFEKVLGLANEVNKPVIIHSREAEQDTLDILEKAEVPVVLHCFAGSNKMAREAIDRGYYLSFSGLVTFVDDLLDIATQVPLNQLLVETDSPFLAPVPNRGKTNQPAYVRHTARTIAEARQLPLEQLAQKTWNNAAALFDW